MSETACAPTATAPSGMRRAALWGLMGAIAGTILYTCFYVITHSQTALFGIPVGILVGQAVHHGARKQGKRRFQLLAVVLAYLSFALTYAPGLAPVIFKNGVTALLLFVYGCFVLISPVLDSQNGFVGGFMVLGGFYLAWTVAGERKSTAGKQQTPK